MFTNHSDLITQIHAIIQRNHVEEKQLEIDFDTIQRSLSETKDPVKKDYYPFLDKADLKRMEERMETLEEQNKKLQCIVQFLLVQLAAVKRTLANNNFAVSEKINGQEEPIRNGNHLSTKYKKSLLTKRETDVFNLLAKGMCAKEIAKMLFISETTVITHKKNLKEKFHAKNTVELISNILDQH
jgi:DNA-binding CsgD family transcriptional regulator